MDRVKEIKLRVIPASVANPFVKAHHYSGKVVVNSQLHFGAFLDGKLHGVLSFGCSMDKRKAIQLVEGTGWNAFLELNRMAFDEYLPRNSESRCIAIALRMIKKQAPHVKWIISYADGTQCGDGTIYRASGFVLTGIKPNSTMIRMPNGDVVADLVLNLQYKNIKEKYDTMCHLDPKVSHRSADYVKGGAQKIPGFQLRYIYFLDPSYKARLTVPILPFTAIDAAGAGMYKGEAQTRQERHEKRGQI